MFGVVHDDGLVGTSRHEDLDSFEVIAVGALVERPLNARCVVASPNFATVSSGAQSVRRVEQ
jgi:hypothetical protein